MSQLTVWIWKYLEIYLHIFGVMITCPRGEIKRERTNQVSLL